MAHPHREWTRERLEGYIGTTETLTLEFKSFRALIPDSKKDKTARIQEAAKDVAGMANEQGGAIIYAVAESNTGTRRQAVSLEEGFQPEDGVSREWFLQFIRDHVHPPLPDIDAVEVPLDGAGQRFALVVLVPQSVGVARQTDDLYFWRRNAQGLHPMSVQEIEDIRLRSACPDLAMDVFVQEHLLSDSRGSELKAQFRLQNASSATASFAVITVGLVRPSSATFLSQPEWRWIQTGDDWKIARCVLASGSSIYWSPITPGFTLVAQAITVTTPFYREVDPDRPRVLGLARLDHDGGSNIYLLRLHHGSPEVPTRLRLESCQRETGPESVNEVVVPALFHLREV